MERARRPVFQFVSGGAGTLEICEGLRSRQRIELDTEEPVIMSENSSSQQEPVANGHRTLLERLIALLGEMTFFVLGVWGTKRPSRPYKDLPFSATKSPEYQAELNSGHYNIAVYLGKASDGLCALDFDYDKDLTEFLELNPTLSGSLR